jgi:medium-chain acyl-[acyl-carrier-protein] hydrolase
MPKSMAGDKWVLYHKPDSRAGLKLFCFPYAGGGIWIYKSWPRYFSDTAQVCTVQLPGRGMRWNEPSYKRLVPLAQAIGEAIVPHLDRPFAFFGHSMGATVSFELTVKPAASRRSLERAVRRGFSTDFNPPERARYAQTERK